MARVHKCVGAAALLLLLLLLTVTAASSPLPPSTSEQQCVYAPPQPNLTYTDYAGVWYEIGRIQTPGGAFFQKDCVCTTLNVSFDQTGLSGSSGNGTVENACRFLEPATGWPVSFVSHLSDMRLPGQWLNRFNSAYAVNYTIIEKGTDAATGEEYSVEYDCGSQALFGTNYCIHILARRPTMSDGLRERLLQRALALGINTRDLPFVLTNQSSTCKYV